MSLSRHFYQKHQDQSDQEYYDTYCRTEGEGICVCGTPTKFLGLAKGYQENCSHKCAGVTHRARLKDDADRFETFRSKVASNQSKIWADRETTGEKIEIVDRIRQTVVKRVETMTPEERVAVFSRYSKCDSETIQRLNENGAAHLLTLIHQKRTGWVKTQKGFFRPLNPQKYLGRLDRIIFRSQWERQFMSRLDTSPDVVGWSSEEIVIPYSDRSSMSSSGGARLRRYYPDFFVELRDGRKMVVEIKPKKETRPPAMGKGRKGQARYITEVRTFAKNVSKWESAKRYCEGRGWQFVVMTEDSLGITF